MNIEGAVCLDLDIPHDIEETCGRQRNDDVAQGEEGDQQRGLGDEHFDVGWWIIRRRSMRRTRANQSSGSMAI